MVEKKSQISLFKNKKNKSRIVGQSWEKKKSKISDFQFIYSLSCGPGRSGLRARREVPKDRPGPKRGKSDIVFSFFSFFIKNDQIWSNKS